MRFPKIFDRALELRSPVAEDRRRNTATSDTLFELLQHDVAIRGFGRFQRDGAQVLVSKGPLQILPDGIPATDNEQALDGPNLNRVIHNPNPILSRFQRSRQFIEAEPQQPVTPTVWRRGQIFLDEKL